MPPGKLPRRTLLAILAATPVLVLAVSIEVGRHPPSAAAQAPTLVTVSEIQGDGPHSPLVGEEVTTSGVVTADFVEAGLNGFFLQATEGDGDPNTSDGLWVYDNTVDAAVSVGTVVTVTGTVQEHFGLTEIELASFTAGGTAELPAAKTLEPPADDAGSAVYLEAREGMRVALPPSRVVGATNRFGEAYVVPVDSGIERLFRGDPAGQKLGLLFPGGWQSRPGGWHSYDFGDRLEGIVGALTYTFGNYKIAARQDAPPEVERSKITPDQVEPSGPGELTIATYNLENLFDPVDDPGKNDGEWTPSLEAYTVAVWRRAISLGENLGAPDIVGVQEVEHQHVLEDVAAHHALAGVRYGAVSFDGPDGRGIDVGLMYNQSKLALLGAEERQLCVPEKPFDPEIECEGGGWMLYSRPPLVAELVVLKTGARLNVIVNHFKSKRGGDAVTTPIRTRMAEHNLALVDELRAEHPNVPVVVLGDLNDFEDTEPLQTLTGGEYLRDLHDTVPPAEDYTYVFNGISQNLDYILIGPELRVREFGPAHVNTDFGSLPDRVTSSDSPRASDHDPLVLRVALPEGPGPVRPSTVYLPLTYRDFSPTEPGTGGGDATPTPDGQATSTPSPPPTATPTPAAGAPSRTPLQITGLFANGDINPREPDEYVAFENITDDAVDLTGWQLISVQGNQRYDFPDGFTIAPGQACRVYTDELHEEHCGLRWGSSQAVWRNSGDKAELRDAAGALIDWHCYGSYEGQCG